MYDGCYITNDVTVGQRSFCLNMFSIFVMMKCLGFNQNDVFLKTLYWGGSTAPSSDSTPSFFEINFV